jgi:hypothetical protein
MKRMCKWKKVKVKMTMTTIPLSNKQPKLTKCLKIHISSLVILIPHPRVKNIRESTQKNSTKTHQINSCTTFCKSMP